jgi:predicted RNA-binding protein with RPS1 domain
MIPRTGPDVVIKNGARDLLLDIADNIFPGVNSIGDLEKGEREHWIIFACGILRGYPDISQYVDAFSEALGRGVDAQISDILERREVDLRIKEKYSAATERIRKKREARAEDKHKADLADQKQRRDDREQHQEERKEWNELGLRDARAKQVHGVWIERILIGMIVVAFILFVTGALTGETLILGSSGAGGLITAIMFALYQVRAGRVKQPRSLSPVPAEGDSAEQEG